MAKTASPAVIFVSEALPRPCELRVSGGEAGRPGRRTVPPGNAPSGPLPPRERGIVLGPVVLPDIRFSPD